MKKFLRGNPWPRLVQHLALMRVTPPTGNKNDIFRYGKIEKSEKMGDNKYNQFLIYFLVFFLSATIYYWFPKRVEKAAITKVGDMHQEENYHK